MAIRDAEHRVGSYILSGESGDSLYVNNQRRRVVEWTKQLEDIDKILEENSSKI